MNNLLYLSYGPGPHVTEIAFSALVAADMIGLGSREYRTIVYTDRPADFAALPVHTHRVSDEVLAEWAGPLNFGHRRKILAIKDALQRYGDRVVYCDADTFFLKHPRHAFARVLPGCTLLHIAEYYLYDACIARLGAFIRGHELRTLAGDQWLIEPATAMFNAGVIGVHESDIRLLDEVTHLTDQIYPHVTIPTIEQFAFSLCFEQRTRLRQSYDLIHHYWQPERRAHFDAQLGRVFANRAITTNQERLRRLMHSRPSHAFTDRPFKGPVDRRLWAILWRAAKRSGLIEPMKTLAKRIGVHHKASF